MTFFDPRHYVAVRDRRGQILRLDPRKGIEDPPIGFTVQNGRRRGAVMRPTHEYYRAKREQEQQQ